MKSLKTISLTVLLSGILAAPLATWAADHDHSSQKKTDKVKPYVLKTCPVSDEKLGGDMGQPYLFTYQDREIKLCCKSCLKDFKKDPKKYLKKIEEAEKKAKK